MDKKCANCGKIIADGDVYIQLSSAKYFCMECVNEIKRVDNHFEDEVSSKEQAMFWL